MSLHCQQGGKPAPGAGVRHRDSTEASSDATKLIKSFPFPVATGKIQGSKKDLWLYNMLLKISADGHKTERICQKNCMM